jgi:hypothetical protein
VWALKVKIGRNLTVYAFRLAAALADILLETGIAADFHRNKSEIAKAIISKARLHSRREVSDD